MNDAPDESLSSFCYGAFVTFLVVAIVEGSGRWFAACCAALLAGIAAQFGPRRKR